MYYAPSFKRGEEKGPVFLDWPAKCPTELVLLVIGPPQVEEAFSVKQLVTQKFVYVAVEGVGSRLGDHVDDGAGVAPIFGIERIGQYAEFRDTVGSRLNSGRVHKQIVAIATVDIEVVGAPAASIHRNSARLIAPVEKI